MAAKVSLPVQLEVTGYDLLRVRVGVRHSLAGRLGVTA